MIELGSDPELREIKDSLNLLTDAVSALTDTVSSLTTVCLKNTQHLEALRGKVEEDLPDSQLENLLSGIMIELRALPGKIEEAMTRVRDGAG